MQREEWVRLAKLAGYVYIPIGLLIVFVFILVQYQSVRVEQASNEKMTSFVGTSTAGGEHVDPIKQP